MARPRIQPVLAASLVMAVFLSACASNVGNSNVKDFGRYISLEKGKSTKRDVYEAFGQPHDVIYITGNADSVWIYFYAQMTTSGATFIPFLGILAGGVNSDTTVANFYFDDSGVFAKSEVQDKSKYVNQWVGIAESAAAASSDKKRARVQAEMDKFNFSFDPKIADQAIGSEILTK